MHVYGPPLASVCFSLACLLRLLRRYAPLNPVPHCPQCIISAVEEATYLLVDEVFSTPSLVGRVEYVVALEATAHGRGSGGLGGDEHNVGLLLFGTDIRSVDSMVARGSARCCE